MSRVIHFEIPANDPQRLKQFFGDVFGWTFEGWGDDGYYLATTGPDGAMGINGAIMQRRDPQQPLVNTISVASIDETIPVVIANGGTVTMPRMAVGDMGFVAYITDPEGNLHGIWEMAAPSV